MEVPDNPPFEQQVAQHDEAVAGAGTEIWVGAEPTFTLP